jgi:GNAT superfamily N-acetyltransferase
MNALALRAAEPSDVPEVRRLVRGLAGYEKLAHLATATEADFARVLFGPRPLAHAALAAVEARAVGVALWYYTLSTFTCRPHLFIEDVFVEPAFRKEGIGYALFRYLAGVAVDESCEGMEWRVLNWNAPALEFYRRIGAKPVTDWTTQELRGDALMALAK